MGVHGGPMFDQVLETVVSTEDKLVGKSRDHPVVSLADAVQLVKTKLQTDIHLLRDQLISWRIASSESRTLQEFLEEKEKQVRQEIFEYFQEQHLVLDREHRRLNQVLEEVLQPKRRFVDELQCIIPNALQIGEELVSCASELLAFEEGGLSQIDEQLAFLKKFEEAGLQLKAGLPLKGSFRHVVTENRNRILALQEVPLDFEFCRKPVDPEVSIQDGVPNLSLRETHALLFQGMGIPCEAEDPLVSEKVNQAFDPEDPTEDSPVCRHLRSDPSARSTFVDQFDPLVSHESLEIRGPEAEVCRPPSGLCVAFGRVPLTRGHTLRYRLLEVRSQGFCQVGITGIRSVAALEDTAFFVNLETLAIRLPQTPEGLNFIQKYERNGRSTPKPQKGLQSVDEVSVQYDVRGRLSVSIVGVARVEVPAFLFPPDIVDFVYPFIDFGDGLVKAMLV